MYYTVFLSLLLTILPVVFQIIYGMKAINKNTSLSFGLVCLLSLVSEFILTFLGFIITSESSSTRGPRDGMGNLSIIILSFLAVIVMLVIMGIQFYISKNKNR